MEEIVRSNDPETHQRKRPRVEHHSSGTIIYRDMHEVGHSDARHRILIFCFKCKETRFEWTETFRRENWSGLCSECRHRGGSQNRKYSGDWCHLSSRSIVHNNDVQPGDAEHGPTVAFTCVGCGEQHRCDIEAPRKTNWTGLCPKCRSARGNPTRRRKQDNKPHKSGAIPLWEERDRTKPNWHRTVPFICRNGHRAVEEVSHSSATDPDWTGLCTPCCYKERGRKRRIFENVTVEIVTLESGSKVLWPEADDKSVPVVCGRCGTARSLSRESVKNALRDPKWTGYCRNSFECLRAQQAKGRRGRRKGVRYIDPQASRILLEKAIRKLWAQHHSISAITYQAVATVFQSAGERIGADALRKRFNECKTGLKWRDFVLASAGQNGN